MRESISLVVELWYAEAPDLADPELLDALRVIAPAAERQEGSLAVPHGAAVDGVPPLLTAIVAASPVGEGGKQLPEVSQTWDWPGADEALDRCRSAVLVSEMFADGFDAEERVSALTAVLRVLARATHPVLISWPLSQRVVDPEADDDDLGGAINIRLFTVAGDESALVLDSLGLHIFGLPDVQCHFRGRGPAEIAALLHATATYLFDAGDVIADGNTISSLDGVETYVCRRERALVAPARTVLDVDLGDPYAAGERDR
jgi:hypothetical protein